MAVVRNRAVSSEHRTAPLSIDGARAVIDRSDMLSVPVNVWALAEYLGLEVQEEIMDEDMSGYLEFRSGRWVAGINVFHHLNRKRFTLAHEIAHFLLHRGEQEKFVDENFTRRVGSRDQRELQADALAADILMPAELLREKINAGMRSVTDLASEFGVSSQALRYRASNLGFKAS